MKTRPARAMAGAVIAGVFFVLGCSPESKATSTLEKYETVFRICKEETEKTRMQPGEHRCALVASMAVEMSLADTGLEQAKQKEMLDKWLDEKGYKAYYIPPEKRPKDAQ